MPLFERVTRLEFPGNYVVGSNKLSLPQDGIDNTSQIHSSVGSAYFAMSALTKFFPEVVLVRRIQTDPRYLDHIDSENIEGVLGKWDGRTGILLDPLDDSKYTFVDYFSQGDNARYVLSAVSEEEFLKPSRAKYPNYSQAEVSRLIVTHNVVPSNEFQQGSSSRFVSTINLSSFGLTTRLQRGVVEDFNQRITRGKWAAFRAPTKQK